VGIVRAWLDQLFSVPGGTNL